MRLARRALIVALVVLMLCAAVTAQAVGALTRHRGPMTNSGGDDPFNSTGTTFASTGGAWVTYNALGWINSRFDWSTTANNRASSAIFKRMTAGRGNRLSRYTLLSILDAKFETGNANTFGQFGAEREVTYSSGDSVTANGGTDSYNAHSGQGRDAHIRLNSPAGSFENVALITLSWSVTDTLGHSGLSSNVVNNATT